MQRRAAACARPHAGCPPFAAGHRFSGIGFAQLAGVDNVDPAGRTARQR
ncbi:hypothetical protein DM81_404 [Burkholderia multivorans]|nr:hypothetical protein DM81_404 [Burkholderia multivorans]